MHADATANEGAQAAIPEQGVSDVAIVIVTFNQAHFLGDAISSALDQTRPAGEVIVVDDGSTDNPGAAASRFEGVRLIPQENRGCRRREIPAFIIGDLSMPDLLPTKASIASCLRKRSNIFTICGRR